MINCSLTNGIDVTFDMSSSLVLGLEEEPVEGTEMVAPALRFFDEESVFVQYQRTVNNSEDMFKGIKALTRYGDSKAEDTQTWTARVTFIPDVPDGRRRLPEVVSLPFAELKLEGGEWGSEAGR